jgi:hypothetical protein
MKMIHAIVFYSNPSIPRTTLEFTEPYDENMSVKEYVEAFSRRVKKENVADRVEVSKMWVDKELIYLALPKED